MKKLNSYQGWYIPVDKSFIDLLEAGDLYFPAIVKKNEDLVLLCGWLTFTPQSIKENYGLSYIDDNSKIEEIENLYNQFLNNELSLKDYFVKIKEILNDNYLEVDSVDVISGFPVYPICFDITDGELGDWMYEGKEAIEILNNIS